MGRAKSELKKRDACADTYGALLAAEGFCRLSTGLLLASAVTLEAEDGDLWDDVTRTVTNAKGETVESRYQVKRQLTDMPKDTMESYLKEAAKSSADRLCFVFPNNVTVKGVGETRILDELIRRLTALGAVRNRVASGLRSAERKWVEFVKAACGIDDEGSLELISRLRVDHAGLEHDLERRALNALAPLFREGAPTAWERFLLAVRGVDGLVEFDAASPPDGLPQAARTPEEALYWDMVRVLEESFAFSGWHSLVDHLVRGLVPLWFVEDGRTFGVAVATTGWPGIHPAVEDGFRELARYTNEYLDHFETRSEVRSACLAADKTWKRIYPNPNYDEESAKSRAWDQGCLARLNNMVKSLNDLLGAIRAELDSAYRLRDGVFAIFDDLGVRNEDAQPSYFVPDTYLPV